MRNQLANYPNQMHLPFAANMRIKCCEVSPSKYGIHAVRNITLLCAQQDKTTKIQRNLQQNQRGRGTIENSLNWQIQGGCS